MARDSIEVRDAKNPDRVLGTLEGRTFGDITHYDRFHMDVMPKPGAVRWRPPNYVDFMVDRATFRKCFREFDSGYSARAEFRTDASLELLMELERFRLPGETEQQAAMRHRCCW